MLIIDRVEVCRGLILVHIDLREGMRWHRSFHLVIVRVSPRKLVLLVLLMNLARCYDEGLQCVRPNNIVAAVVHLKDREEEIFQVFVVGALFELQSLNVIVGFSELNGEIAEE